MINAVTGGLAMALAALFFGYYAAMIDRPALWVIILGSLALAVADYALSLGGRQDVRQAEEEDAAP